MGGGARSYTARVLLLYRNDYKCYQKRPKENYHHRKNISHDRLKKRHCICTYCTVEGMAMATNYQYLQVIVDQLMTGEGGETSGWVCTVQLCVCISTEERTACTYRNLNPSGPSFLCVFAQQLPMHVRHGSIPPSHSPPTRTDISTCSPPNYHSPLLSLCVCENGASFLCVNSSIQQ